jgi:hypothetical protein
MSILDDAIREHLELKRAHGADDTELKKLEDEAFGPPARPDEHDPFAEAPTEFLVSPEVGAGEQDDEGSAAPRTPNIADLQESPLPPETPPAEQSAMEHEAVPAPHPEDEPAPQAEIEGGHSTEERHAIAEQPTEMFDVEGQFEDAATEADAPSDDELVDAEMAEPRLAPVDPLAGIEAEIPGEPEVTASPALADDEEPADEFDEFFSEQRLSDELNQALEAPLPDEPGAPVTEEATAIFDVEAAEPAVEAELEEPVEEEEDFEEISEEQEIPATGEHEIAEDDSEEHELPPLAEDESEEQELPPLAAAEPDTPAPPPAGSHEDVLEDTPEFLEDAPEDDELWFEQKPPKDFDFDD